MGDPYTLTDRARLAFRQAVASELLRAGQTDPHLADKVLSGDETSRGLLNLLMDTGDPDKDIQAVALEHGISHPSAVKYLDQQREQQFRGFQGRGWSKDELEALRQKGQMKDDFLLSEGGRQADRWTQNRALIRRMLELEKQWGQAGGAAPPGHPSHKREQDMVHSLQEQAVRSWENNQNRTHGQAGWGGPWMESDEYAFGWFNNTVSDPLYQAYDYWAHGRDEPSMAESLSRSNRLMRARNQANDVDPVLPGNPKGWREKEAELQRIRDNLVDMKPSNYDQSVRRETGQYPSYAGSTGQFAFQNLLDYTSFIPVVGSIPKAIGGVFKAGASAVTKGATSAIAKEAAKDAAKAIGRETTEEMTGQGGIGGAITATHEMTGESKIPWGSLFTPGNEARTDLHIRDPQTNQMRAQTQEEWEKDDRQADTNRTGALSQHQHIEAETPKYKKPPGVFGRMFLGGLLPIQ